ncbi:MAG: hypothetical protein HUJ83_09480 [Veillonella sp.]|nr:hypothetical protein [Veillonella sp.]
MKTSFKHMMKRSVAVFVATLAIGFAFSAPVKSEVRYFLSSEYEQVKQRWADEARARGYTVYDSVEDLNRSGKTSTTPACSHDYKSQVTLEATCAAEGEMIFTCSKCNKSYKEKIAATGNHNYESTVTKEATCLEDGINTFKCTTCEDSYEEPIEATGHDYVDNVALAATCLEDGTLNKVCSHCNDTIEEVIPAKGHTEGGFEITKKSGLFTKGEQVKKCTDCGEILDTEVIDSQYPISVLYIIMGAVLVLAGVVAIVVARKKKHKDINTVATA